MYEHDAEGRLSSSTTTLEPEWADGDIAWLDALLYLERHEGQHGHPMWEATSPDADPNNPDATHGYVAGTPIVDPEGRTVWAATFDWAEKTRADFLDRLRGNEPDSLNGVIVPVHRVARVPASRRTLSSPLARLKQHPPVEPPPTT